jgi:lysophospholipase L1-like esterase
MANAGCVRHATYDLVGRGRGGLHWVGRVAVLLVCVVGLVTAAATTAAADQATIPAGPVNATGERLFQVPVTHSVDYVALGDSYSSGVGTGVYEAASGVCARSPLSYPPLWAAEHQPASFTFAACSGATTADVLAHQISAVGAATDLVTITIGGNDAGFSPVLQTCTVAPRDSACLAAVNAAEVFETFVLPARLTRTYAAIRTAAPHAKVAVLGYPRLFELTPACPDSQVPNLARRQKLNEGADLLNNVIRTVAQWYGLSFTDVRGRFVGHGVCSVKPWVNGPSVSPSLGPYHPNQTGYRDGYLPALDATTAHSFAVTQNQTEAPRASTAAVVEGMNVRCTPGAGFLARIGLSQVGMC